LRYIAVDTKANTQSTYAVGARDHSFRAQ